MPAIVPKVKSSQRTRDLQAYEHAKTERSNLLPVWQKITEYLLPYSGRYWTTRPNQAASFASILDNTATWAHRTLVSGLMTGVTDPTRPWVAGRMANPDFADSTVAADWADDVSAVILQTFDNSNTYTALRSIYSELAAFGTACAIVERDDENVLHLYTLTAGQYCLKRDLKGNVNGVFREIVTTVEAAVKEFGYDAQSPQVKTLWDSERYDDEVRLLHVIDERKQRDPTKRDNRNMPFRSVYYDMGAGDDVPPLRDSGYDFFPVLAPRWEVEGDDVYGLSPAMVALGDIRGLQHKQVRLGEVIDRQTNPATQGPVEAEDVDTLPGTHIRTSGAGAVTEVVQTRTSIADLYRTIIEGDHPRIMRAFSADAFAMFTGDTRSGITAAEIRARMQEKLQQLGPVYMRLVRELLEPLVAITYAFLLERGMIPPTPPELAGEPIKFKFVNELAMAQQASASIGTVRWVDSMSALAAAYPEAKDRVSVDDVAEELRETYGAPARVMVDRREVVELRQRRAQMEAAAQQMQAAQQMATATKDLAAAPEENSVLSRMMGVQ